MSTGARHGFVAQCEEVCPGFQPIGGPRRGHKTDLLCGEVAGAPVIAKRLRQPSPVWGWFVEREHEIYRGLSARPPAIRVPRLIGAGAGVLVIERLPGAPLATRRHPNAILSPRAVRTLLAMRDSLAAWDAPATTPPSADVRTQLRARLLEDPISPVDWVREGVARSARLEVLDAAVARRIDDALAAHAPIAFGHGGLVLRNVIGDGDDLGLIDWQCAGPQIHDWDVALLWSQLAPRGRSIVEEEVAAGGAARWRTFLGLIAFVLAREICFLLGYRVSPQHSELVRLRRELEEVSGRVRQAAG